MRIAKGLKTDKRTKSVIGAKVEATKVLLRFNCMKLSLSHVEAKRIANVLNKAVAIQETRRTI